MSKYTYKEIDGDLISMALAGEFDVIAHGCNCFCTQGAGIAVQMAKVFGTDRFPKEAIQYRGSINKLGTIDWLSGSDINRMYSKDILEKLIVVNAYTQFMYGTNHTDGVAKPLDYDALILCLRKINHIFKGKHIGLPGFIGGGLAGGDNDVIRNIIKKELADCDVTIVFYHKIIILY